nr:CDP-glycerol glycerophosphotransferase family protein [Halomonas sp.]
MRLLSDFIFGFIKLALVLLISKLYLLIKNKDIWLVCERPDESRDNGYHFFRHIKLHHPEVRIYYVISPESADYAKTAQLGPVVHWGSFKHYLYWCLAKCVVSAHPGDCSPEPRLGWRLKGMGLIRHISANIKHGVIAINLPDYHTQTGSQQLNLVSCASPREMQFLEEVGGYRQETLQLLGLCRFDALHETVDTRRQVLFMPTWRRWFRGLVEKHGRQEAMRMFRDSDYFQAYSTFLNSKRLHAVLERTGYDLIFYPHHGVQEYLEAFGETHSRITIADRHHYDVQQLLKESAVLISDFSSVSFDFAYMGKPMVYLLPDEERYFSDHFQRGYFDFDHDGFGPVARDPDAAVDALEAILIRGRSSEKHQQRVEAFFPLRDSANCERTFQAIQKIVDG